MKTVVETVEIHITYIVTGCSDRLTAEVAQAVQIFPFQNPALARDAVSDLPSRGQACSDSGINT